MKVVVIGAGPAGALIALALARIANISNVTIYETQEDLSNTPQGHSMTLHPNGMRSIDRVGADILEAVIRGSSKFTSYRSLSIGVSPDQLIIPSIELKEVSHVKKYAYPRIVTRRQYLRDTMLDVAVKEGCTVKLGYTLQSISEIQSTDDEKSTSVMLAIRDPNGRICNVEADLVIGADGLNSAVRSYVVGTVEDKPYSYKTSALLGIAENKDIPSGSLLPAGNIFSGAISSPPDHPEKSMVMLMQAGPKHTYWSTIYFGDKEREELATIATEGQLLAAPENAKDYLLRRFKRIPALCDFIRATPTRALYLRQSRGRPIISSFRRGAHAVLIGDAAHPIRPTKGYGVNLALEDGLQLAVLLKSITANEGGDHSSGEKHATLASKLDKVLQRYDELRVSRTGPLWEQSENAVQHLMTPAEALAHSKQFEDTFLWEPEEMYAPNMHTSQMSDVHVKHMSSSEL